ncbi:MAG: prolyl oligopeptidase family serine peptidase, partial [Kiritimatiellales bacterium]
LLLALSLSATSLFAAETFLVDGRKAVIHPAANPAKGKPWLWYAPALNGGVSIVQHKLYADACQQAGIAIAGYDLGEVRGAPKSAAQFTKFYDEMVKRGYSPKPILLGQSRGGLMMLTWAMRHPDKVTAFAGIYPVCNLASWPMKNSKPAVLSDYKLSEAELVANLSRYNPVDNLQGLLANKVPLFIVHGNADVVVPYEDNGGSIKQRYEAGGGQIEVKIIDGLGHTVKPEFFECEELLDFIIKQTAGKK